MMFLVLDAFGIVNIHGQKEKCVTELIVFEPREIDPCFRIHRKEKKGAAHAVRDFMQLVGTIHALESFAELDINRPNRLKTRTVVLQ